MIGEALIDLCFSIFRGLFTAMEFVSLPTQLISTLSTITAYGVWVVGADILGLLFASVVGWWGVQMSIGLAVWLWDRLPLT